MRLAVIGTGYVGLVSGVCFSEVGFNVTCVDKDAQKIAGLQKGVLPIYEPGLEELVVRNYAAGRLTFSTDLATSVKAADVVMIAVGTPERADGMPDLSALDAVVKSIAAALDKYTVIIIKSTVPLGTNRKVAQDIAALNPAAQFDVVSNPEFLREGAAIKDFMSPDRVVAGIATTRAKAIISRLYAPLTEKGAPLLFTTYESAEMIKYVANCILSLRLSFINEMADICEKTGANIIDVGKGVGLDHRIGTQFMRPGPGYGGSCFPKDTLALQQMARGAGVPSSLVEATIASNFQRKERMVGKVVKAAGGSVKGKTIAVLGLTFKPATNDMRESASLVILPALMAQGARLNAYDPQGMKEARHMLSGDITWCRDSYDALEGADMALLLTEWDEFTKLDLQKAKDLLKTPIMVDLRNVYKRAAMRKHGFHYVSIGRQEVIPGGASITDMLPEDEKAA